jgi:hypothetical protein
MMSSYPSLAELLWLFEADPEVQFPDPGWPASAATWTTRRGEFVVVCTISPFERCVQIDCDSGGETVVQIRLLDIVELVAIDRSHGIEALVVTCEPEAGLDPVRLQLKPHVSIRAATATG